MDAVQAKQDAERARQARSQEMPSPEPAPAVVHAEAVDVWTNKPFCTVSLHRKEHEVSLSRDEADDLVVRVFNTNSGDRFERIVNEEGIAQLVPAEMPAGVTSREGFAQFLQLALEREAGSANPESVQITCESREGREDYTAEIALTTGSGMFAARYPVTLAIPLRSRATSGDKHLIALRTLSDKFSGEVEAQEEKLMEVIDGLQQQLNLMKLQMNNRVFFGVNHSVHVDVEKLAMADRGAADVAVTSGHGALECGITGQWQHNSVHRTNPGQDMDAPSMGSTQTAFASTVSSTERAIANVAVGLFATDTEFIMPMPSPLLEPLQLCRKLTQISIPKQYGRLITDLDFLRGLPALECLELDNPDIREIKQLATLPSLKVLCLKNLSLEGGGHIDLSPLAGVTTLEELDFSGSAAVGNVAFLAKRVALKKLNITGTSATDRQAFAGNAGIEILG
jgi:hypothetical protein